MELTPRKKAILAEIVLAHIETGEPIGSKILAEKLPNAPSTATLRNEMSDLCEMGYLEQPHTSAGRLPTSKAYRLYVTELMKPNALSEEGRELIDRMLSSVTPDPESISAAAADILSKLTGLPTLTALGVSRRVRIKRVSLLPMGKNSAVIFVITDDGRARSRFVYCETRLTPQLIELFDRLVGEKVLGRDVTELDAAYLQSVAVLGGLDTLSLAPLLSGVFELARQTARTQVEIGGAANLFSICKGDAEAKRLLQLLGEGDTVHSLFSRMTSPVDVIFGDDTAYSELKPTGMIVASYGSEQELGRIAVIGPTRMAYSTLMPSVEYMAKRVGKIMTDVLKGLEE